MTTASGKPAIPFKARVRKQTAIVTRWLHIYLSMVSFGLVLFFAVTGLTLNHEEWFENAQRSTTSAGTMPVALLQEPDKLRIVEFLRNTHHVHAALGDVNVDTDQVTVSFKGPGYSADTAVQRATGAYQLVETRNGFWAVMNDLHKGRDTGKGWAWVIDLSAGLLTLVSLSGLLLIFFVYKKRTAGLIVATVGCFVAVLLYKLFVP